MFLGRLKAVTEAVVPRYSVKKKGVLKNLAKLTGKHLCQSLWPGTLLKKRLWHRRFPVNFAKYLRTPFCKTPRVAASAVNYFDKSFHHLDV